MANPLFGIFTYWFKIGAPTSLQQTADALVVQLVPAVDESYGMVNGIAWVRQHAGVLLPLVAIDTIISIGIVILTVWLACKLVGRCIGLGSTCAIMFGLCVAIAISVWALVTLIVISRREEARAAMKPPPEPSVLSTAFDALLKLNPMG